MSNHLTTRNSTSISQPIAHDRDLADRVAAFRNGLERDASGEMTITALPSAPLRERMKGRLETLRTALRPASMSIADKSRLAKAVAQLLSGWMNTGRSDPQSTVASYVVHLQDMPAFAVEQACHDVAKGYVEGLSPDFPPSAPRLHQLAAEAVAKLNIEAVEINQVLDAKLRHVPTEGERERIKVGLQALSQKLSGEDEATKAHRATVTAEQAAADRQIFERDCRSAGVDPAGGVSPSLLKQLGKMPKPQRDTEAA